MDSRVFEECLAFYNNPLAKDFWKPLSEKFGYTSKETLRSEFKRERQRRGIPSKLEVIKTNKNVEEPSRIEDIPYNSFTEKESLEKTVYQEGDNYINIVCTSPRIITKNDVIRHFNVDTNIWSIKEFTVKTSEGYRKDRSVEWKVEDGRVVNGEVHDSGKLIIAPMFHTETKFIKKNEFSIEDIDRFFKNLGDKNFQAKPVVIERKLSGKCLVIPISDLHLGLYSTEKVCGNEYNMEIAEKSYYRVISETIERVKNVPIQEVCFIAGNDLLNSDNISGNTSHGTPQDNADFWYALIDKAIEMIIGGVELLREIAPVKIYSISSNHDEHSFYCVMKAVELYFRNVRDVTVDTSPLPRKYYYWGNNILALSHDMNIKTALDVVSVEAKDYWSKSDHVVLMLGHLHQAMQYEKKGMLEIYRLPTISGASRWSNGKGYVQSEKKNQCFILDDENGIETVMNIVV